MINSLRGKLTETNLTRIIVDVGGVGYEINIPLSTFDRLPKVGGEISILTHLCHRDDQMTLYGFMTEEEKTLFRMLIGVSGIGPKAGLNILSGISVDNFKAAVARGDVNILKSVKGIGPKTASRLMVELKEQIGLLPSYEKLARQREPSSEQKMLTDAVMALISLGYNQASAHKAIKVVLNESEKEIPVEEIIKRALKHV